VTSDQLPNSLQRTIDRIHELIRNAAGPRLDDPATLFAHYLDHCSSELQLTARSLRQQYYYLRYILRWFAEHQQSFPQHTSVDAILDFLAFQRDVRGNSLVQRRHYLDTFRRFFRLLVRDGLLSVDPTETINLKTPSTSNIHQILDIDELDRLIDTARHDRDHAPARFRLSKTRDAALVGLLAATGCRLAEALALVRSRIDLKAAVAFYPGKGDLRHAVKERVVPIENEGIRRDIALWLDLRPTPHDTIIFVTASGRIVEPTMINQRLNRLARRANIQRKVTPHSLRATFASRLIDNGIDPAALQQLMGHSRLSTTLTLYTKLDVRSLHDTWRRTNPLATLPEVHDHEETD